MHERGTWLFIVNDKWVPTNSEYEIVLLPHCDLNKQGYLKAIAVEKIYPPFALQAPPFSDAF